MRDTDYPIVWRDKRTGKQKKNMRRTREMAMTLARLQVEAGHTDVRWKGVTWKHWYDHTGKRIERKEGNAP